MKDVMLGVDIGSTGTKAMVKDKNGNILATAYRGYTTYNDRISWAEQDANNWWDAVVTTIRECIEDNDIRRSVVSIGLSSQGGSVVPIDEKGIPLRRAITWMDQRAYKQRDVFTKDLPEDYIYNVSGWKLGNALNALQIRWMRENEPEIFKSTHKFLSTIDFISYKLTGEYFIDPSNAGITQMINLHKMEWDKSILDLIGIHEGQLSEIVESGVKIGGLSKAASLELGLSEGVSVVSGGHDQYCVALGAGAVNQGDVVLATGTAWVVLGISNKPRFNTETYIAQSRHTVKGMWGSMGALGTGGMSLEWYRKSLGKEIEEEGRDTTRLETYREIDNGAAERQVGSRGIFFYPHFNGSGYPTWAALNKGTFLGLDLSHNRYDIARAIMEGVAFEANWMLEEMTGNDTGINNLKMLGGASKSSLWSQIIADITGVPIIVPQVPDVACVGAAILAGLGTGIYSDAGQGYNSIIKKEKEILPQEGNTGQYRELFEKYKEGFRYISEAYKL